MSVRTFSSRAAKLAVAAVFTTAAVACGSSNPTAPAAAVIAAPVSQTGTFTANTATAPTGLAGSGVTPTLDYRGNPTCKDLAATYGAGATWFELKLDRLPNATDGIADGAMSVSITNGSANGFDWTSTRGVDAVLVKAGSGPHNVYLYSPEAAADSGVVTADKYAISHITFCYDVELLVSKTAATTFTRDYDWTIAKSVDQPVVTLASGADATVNYAVAVTKDAGTDSAWAVAGTVAVTNPHPSITASNISVTDEMSDHGAVAVSCPSTSLAPLASMTCSYGSVSLASGAARTNTATATPGTYGFAAGTGTAGVSFVTPTTVHDGSVGITDTFAGAALSNFALAASRTFTYTRTIAASTLTCGVPATIGNTATLATDDGATASSSASVVATLTCAPPPPVAGCTLTQGYWGTHSARGPAKYDATWALIGENTPFYQSGATYYGVMQLPTKGNAYYVLAHQFIAAKLNILKGAAQPAGFNMGAVEAFFQTYTPAQIGAMKGSAPVRAQALAWASTLDTYNNGRLNVSHCGS